MHKMEFVSRLTSTRLKETIVVRLAEILFDGRYNCYDLTEGCKRLLQIIDSEICDRDDFRSLVETIPGLIRADDVRELLELDDWLLSDELIGIILAQPHNQPKKN